MKNELTMKLKMATAMLLLTLNAMATSEKVDSTQATASPSETTVQNVHNQIMALLKRPSNELLALTERVASVVYTTNTKGHLVILEVEASHPALQTFVLKKLQNQRLIGDTGLTGQKMKLTIRFK